jgi:threonine dehydrogenase-like Zn-dependent dehydrogenase
VTVDVWSELTMQTTYIDMNIPRLAVTKALGRVWPGACLSPISPTRFATRPDPPLPHPRSVRVRNRVSLICGSDLHLLFAEADPRIAIVALPSVSRVYLGHEVCGEVTEIGEAVSAVSPGDRVALQYPVPTCATQGIESPCPRCAQGQFYLCENQAVGLGSLTTGGGWGDQMVVHERQLYRPPESLSDDAVALLEPAAVGLHAVLRALPRPGQRVLVVGCGVVGLMTLQALRALAPESLVTAFARHEFQAEIARDLTGCDVYTAKNGYEVTRDKTGAHLYQGKFGSRMLLGGFDTVFDCVGTSATLSDALRWVRADGVVVAVGVQYKMYKVDLSPLYFQEVRLLGTWGYGVEEWHGERLDTFTLAARLVQSGDLTFDHLITHRFPLSRWREAVAVAADKRRYRSVKVVLEP